MVLPSTAIRRDPSFAGGVKTARVQGGKQLPNLSMFINMNTRRKVSCGGMPSGSRGNRRSHFSFVVAVKRNVFKGCRMRRNSTCRDRQNVNQIVRDLADLLWLLYHAKARQ